MRDPCTCGKDVPLCPACHAWEIACREEVTAALWLRLGRAQVKENGKLTSTRYTAETVRLVQQLWDEGKRLNEIAIRTGVACRSVRRVVRMELVENGGS